jgi:protein-disulfide isomerase
MASSARSRNAQAAALIAEQKRQEQRRRTLAFTGVAAVLALIVGLTWWGVSRDTSGEKASVVPQGVSKEYGVVLGDASAPKTITLYEDLQCPICSDFEAATGEQVQAAIDAGKVKLDLRIVSFLDGQSTTKYSSRAANAAFVVLDTSGAKVFKKFHDLLYANQPAEGSAGLSDAELIDFAVQAGANKAQITGPIRDKVYDQWIVNATDRMSKNGVTGTPTGFIDDKRVDGNLQALIDAVLAAVA